jgi:hypothetical protein
MRFGTMTIGLGMAALLSVGTGCAHHDKQADAGNTGPNTMALAQGDKVGRALLAPVGPSSEATADIRAESMPAD